MPLRINGSHAQATREQLLAVAQRAYDNGELALAASKMQAVLAQDTQDAELQMQLGVVLLDLDRISEAVTALESALALQPELLDALNALGVARFRQGRLEEAESLFRQVLDRDSEHSSAQSNLQEAVQRQANAAPRFGRRQRFLLTTSDLLQGLQLARSTFQNGDHRESIDLYEQLIERHPGYSTQLLAEVYDRYQELPYQEDRYHLYQSRHFDFGITAENKVLDIGSGHLPFPLATHLAEYAISDNQYGRAGQAFKQIAGKPVFECSVEAMPFANQEFDFIYCSHVLEHVDSPENACEELMRVGKRGYIETPTRGKDLWLNTAKISNHRWAVEWIHDTLIFTEYTPHELDGLRSDILLSMHCNPETLREKALSALVLIKSDMINTMVLWERRFNYEVRRNKS